MCHHVDGRYPAKSVEIGSLSQVFFQSFIVLCKPNDEFVLLCTLGMRHPKPLNVP